MKTSVIITTYNGQDYIEEQLESIRKQTEKIDQIIIADDCSSDNTTNIISDFIEKYNLNPFWRLILNRNNKGYARNFLETALSAEGDIIYFSDQDDIWNEDKVEIMNEIMRTHTEINVLCCSIILFFTGDRTQRIDKKYMNDMSDNGRLEKFEMNRANFHLKRPGCAMCVRREFLHFIYSYWVANWPHDDFFWKMGIADGSLYKINRILMRRRMHNNNTTIIKIRTRNWRILLLESYEIQYNAMLEYAEKIKLPKDDIEVIKRNIKAITLRINLITNKNLFCWLLLVARYLDCYSRVKGVYLDLYLTLFDKTENARI